MSDKECCQYYHETGKIPPMNLFNWVHVYNLLVNEAFKQLVINDDES